MEKRLENPILESEHFIVLTQYKQCAEVEEPPAVYQTEEDLEREFIADLQKQGYEYAPELKTPQAMLKNVRCQLERLNAVRFTEAEWERFVQDYLNPMNEGVEQRSKKIHEKHYKDFIFDDGHLQNIYLVDKTHVMRNKLQVIRQFEQGGNRYDVTILVNGLPMVQVELKKRGVAIREAFNQVHRYSKESFNREDSLYQYVQIFVISNGTDTRYFANTLHRDKGSYSFTMHWASADNEPIKDLKDFTHTFFAKNTLLQVLLIYSVFSEAGELLVMRPYQIAAAERILWKIKCSHEKKLWGCKGGGGYIWHTTGSGKTLTSFKTARLAMNLHFVKMVFFVVDRKDLDEQACREYKKFSEDSFYETKSIAHLKKNIQKEEQRIVVTTLQKLNMLLTRESNLPIYQQEVVFIFDECHRSQFGEAQKNLQKRFKKYYQFGFTGTPIFPENAMGTKSLTTGDVFGEQLHSYVITDAIRDEMVLKFRVDYNNVRAKFRDAERVQDVDSLNALETREMLLHSGRIRAVCEYILANFRIKTHRVGNNKGFNAMLAVSSIEAAKRYYMEFKKLQAHEEKPLKIVTIFSFVPNEAPLVKGEIPDETFNTHDLLRTDREFLQEAIEDYNQYFASSYSVYGEGFQNYYQHVSQKMKAGEIDLLIVVGMFLTGFDAKCLNTLFVDKNLRYHGLIQAYSRTNRLYDASKTFGNIVTFRDLDEETQKAITLFGKASTKASIILEKSFKEYIEGFTDELTGRQQRGYVEVVQELETHFPNPAAIETEAKKKEFVKTFGEFLKLENVLQNYDEYTHVKAFQTVDTSDAEAVKAFQEQRYISDEAMESIRHLKVLPQRMVQDYRSTYNDIRDWRKEQRQGENPKESTVDWDDVVFEVELLKLQEIDLDYILELLFEHNQELDDKALLLEEIRRLIRSSMDNRAKETLIIEFIHDTDLESIPNKVILIDDFYRYAKERMQKEADRLIKDKNLQEEPARRYMQLSLKRGYASEYGTALSDMLPAKMSRLNLKYLKLKKEVYQAMVAFVERYKGISNQV